MNVPDPQSTYALVVGIEKYDAGSSWSLDGPASDALKFADWLSDRDVPNKNIFLFISELDENQDKVNDFKITRRKATRKNIYQAITETIPNYGQQGDLLYIYWSGHGVTNDYEDRRLYYDDGKQNLNLKSLLKSLKSDFWRNFAQQILIIDACANYYPKKSSKSLSKEEYTAGNLKDRQQVLLLATKEGYRTQNIDTEKIGLFSKVLLEELEKELKLLLPEGMRKIAESIQRIFKHKYYNKPTPIYLWNRDADGSEQTFPLTQSAHKSIILEETWKELESILAKIDRYILYVCCYFVLSQFSKDINGNYPEINSLKSEVTDQKDIPNILKDIFFKIINNQENQKQIFIVIRFVCYLLCVSTIQEETRSKLREWNKKTSNELNKIGINVEYIKQEIDEDLRKIKEKYKKFHPYLMIVYEPKSSEKFYLSAEVIFQKYNDESNLRFPVTDKIEATSINIQDKFDDFLVFSYKIIQLYGFKKEQLIVEMFLPNHQLAEPSEKSYEKIKIKIDTFNNREWVGCHHKFVLRSFERLANLDYIPLTSIKEKWDRLNTFNSNEQEIHNRFKWIYCKEDCNFQSDSDIFGINLLSSSEINIIDLLQQQIIGEGLPFFLWIRGICDEREQLREEFINHLLTLNNLKNLDDLFKTIKDKRLHAYTNYIQEQRQDSLGYHLGFLCDNPYRLPSQYNIIGDDIVVDFGF